ncbi:MAG: peptidase [Thermoanaerobaculia bacterium]|nr:peptidase [Thermoanaerobaculia bacterium]
MNRYLKATIPSLLIIAACATAPSPSGRTEVAGPALAPDIDQRLEQLPQVPIDYDRNLLDERQEQVLAKLVEASKFIDEVFLLQVSEENPELRQTLYELALSDSHYRDAYEYFRLMYGRWDRLAEGAPFIGPFGPEGAKPAGAGFYPPDITPEELEEWTKNDPAAIEKVQGLFTVIRRENDELVAIPYSVAYRNHLLPAAEALREAARLTRNRSLSEYLTKRADAFLSDDYYESDIAWMDLDSDLEVVIGPYEVYEDTLNNYKAAFESFLTVVDRDESRKLTRYVSHLPRMEQNLPIPDEHKNPNRGAESPIKVVQEIFTAGDTRAGVQTAAFNLPNDERVREAKGSKKVLLKNVMEAKFEKTGHPIAMRLLTPEHSELVSFDPFFNHVLFHELSHGLGPGVITGPDGEKVETRLLLKEAYSTIEEAKADVAGIWNILYAMENGLLDTFERDELFSSYAGLMFRSMRFGLDSAHGRGNAIQWNWMRNKSAIIRDPNGRFRVNYDLMEDAVESLLHELLMIEATGDYQRAQRLLRNYGVASAEIEQVIASLEDLPVDIAPVYVAAGETFTRR